MTPHFAQTRPTAPVEWPTILLAIVIYGGWAGLTYAHRVIPIYLLIPLGAWLVAWHGSLQHEVIHDHPTRHQALNDLIGLPSLALWLPYAVYRESHLTHHRDARLTDPYDDPESRYWTLESWRTLSPFGRLMLNAQSVLLGRLVLGPAWTVAHFLTGEAKRLAGGDRARLTIWLGHGAIVALLLCWLKLVCGFSLLEYVFCIVYPATALLQIRSFAEHRAATRATHRTAIVEHAPIFGLLFLHNNLHIAHHSYSWIPWYDLPGYYRRHRAAFIKLNGGLVYDGYAEVFRRFLLKAHDRRLHPSNRVPPDETATATDDSLVATPLG